MVLGANNKKKKSKERSRSLTQDSKSPSPRDGARTGTLLTFEKPKEIICVIYVLF
jgi:hypothetical protein